MLDYLGLSSKRTYLHHSRIPTFKTLETLAKKKGLKFSRIIFAISYNMHCPEFVALIFIY